MDYDRLPEYDEFALSLDKIIYLIQCNLRIHIYINIKHHQKCFTILKYEQIKGISNMEKKVG